MKRNIAFLIVVTLILGLFSGCSTKKTQEDIIVLYTNDVHCKIEENIGYAGLASYKARCEINTPYVTLVDCGDAVQGDFIGTVSEGNFTVQLMNEVGYDFATIGNHEFDYGMERLSDLLEEADATYLGCNIDYKGSAENKLNDVKPYEIKKYGNVSVAYIGVATPESIAKSRPTYFMENEEFVYDFCGESGATLFARVQNTIDECKAKKADYIVVLSHLGDDAESSPFTSVELIQNTTGIDAVLDGHTHSVIPCRVEQDKSGDDVLLSSTGTALQNIGQLVITPNGNVSVGLISQYGLKDKATEEYIENIKTTYSEKMNTVVANSDITLSCSGTDGVRLVRNRETTIGNFCADAYRSISGADIALINGGGIRADLKAGDLTYADIIAVHPFGNSICMVKATGQEILDCLELSVQYTSLKTADNGNSVGEFGGFQQVSGIKFTVDTSVASGVTLDKNGMFVSVSGARRVTDVFVLNKDGVYEPIDAEKTYTVASHNYLIKECGNGFNMFADNEMLIDEGMSDYQMLITYITEELGGKLNEKYGETEGRITIK